MWQAVKDFALRAEKDLRNIDPLDLAPRLTLILLILYAGNYWYLTVPLRVLCIGALLYRPIYRSGVFWFLATCFLVASNYQNWYVIDNHKYLMTYWTLVLTIIFFHRGTERQRSLLANNARLLIGLCMVFATFWKIISPDYLDGSFFRHTLLTDGRFGSVAEAVGGLDPEDFYRNDRLEKTLLVGTRDQRIIEQVQLASTPRLDATATFLTWWTIGIEGLIGLIFLLPARWGPPVVWRHALLLLFAVTTYSVATVIGFGWLLIIMAIAHVPKENHRLRLAYVGVFLLMLVYTGSWASLLLPPLSRMGII
ncbi:MAG: hypothetical protein AAF604_10765 [Acidobacteriota bacterium]